MSWRYDAAASLYNGVSRALWFEHELRAAAGVALGSPARVLDVGCGTGFQLAHLPATLREVVGVDSSARSLEVASREAARRGLGFSAVHSDAAELRWPAASFDAAISVFAMSVIPRWELALAACVEAVRPGGAVVVLEQTPATAGWARLVNPLAGLANAALGARASRDFAAALEKCGCRVDARPALGGLYTLFVTTTPSSRCATRPSSPTCT